ncbi:hypothetical protein D3C80_1690460 [compost metagenome]
MVLITAGQDQDIIPAWCLFRWAAKKFIDTELDITFKTFDLRIFKKYFQHQGLKIEVICRVEIKRLLIGIDIIAIRRKCRIYIIDEAEHRTPVIHRKVYQLCGIVKRRGYMVGIDAEMVCIEFGKVYTCKQPL